MNKNHILIQQIITVFTFMVLICIAQNSAAQYVLNSDSAFKAASPNSGRLWGLYYGDYFYKAHSDSSQRGGNNQYTGIPQTRAAFQSRRIYLGYDYNISSKFSSELLLAAEDNFPAGNPPTSATASGDELSNTKLAFFIKLANLRWKNIWKGTDFVFGQMLTPANVMMSEKVWNYRSIERTITDVRRTPPFDFGAALQGVFDPATRNFGYNIMVANGTGAKPESSNFKWFYGDVYAYFFDKHLVLDAYADYNKLNWTTSWHHSRQMLKGFIAYNSAASAKGMDPGTGFTIGTEFFVNNLKNDCFASKLTGGIDTLNNVSTGVSVFVHGDIIKNQLRFFARLDAYNPTSKVNNSQFAKYVQNTSSYNDNTYLSTTNAATGDETYKQKFISAGLDYIPAKNIHIIPNIWYNSYASQLAVNSVIKSVAANNYDLVYRLTFSFVFGK